MAGNLSRVAMAAIAMATAPFFNVSALAQSEIERGHYLVEGILTCGNCHSPRGPGGIVEIKLYSGGPQTWDEPTFLVKGANITPDPDTGIGKWGADNLKNTLLTGMRPNGVQLAPIMPYAFYKVFTPSDLDAVVAYLRSVPAIHNEVQPPVYKAALHPDTVPGADKPMTDPDLDDPLKRGFYLATIGHCFECHTPIVNDHHDFTNLGRGGQEFKGPWGMSVSRNITSDKQKGIGAWSDIEIKRAITHGISRDGSQLKPPMGFPWYARMSEADLNAIVRYLRTVPPKQ